MRIIAQSSAKPSAWTRQEEVVNDHRAEKALVKRDALEIESEEEEIEEDKRIEKIEENENKQDVKEMANGKREGVYSFRHD
jgi:hypothetical protein